MRIVSQDLKGKNTTRIYNIYIYYLLFSFWLVNIRIGGEDARYNIKIVVRVWCTYVLRVVGAAHNVSIKGSEEWMTFEKK